MDAGNFFDFAPTGFFFGRTNGRSNMVIFLLLPVSINHGIFEISAYRGILQNVSYLN